MSSSSQRTFPNTKTNTDKSDVTVGSQCRPFNEGDSDFLRRGGEFSGNYHWTQENRMKNYVLFELSRKSVLTKSI